MGASHAINSHEKAFSVISEEVWFEADTALKEGQGVCYNWDYGTATAADGRRGNRVELPTILNAPHFAGVADKVYAARTGGQFITINQPGSYCNVWSAANNTIGAGISTCEAGTGGNGAGFFGREGFQGKGSFTPLQTINRGTPGLCFGYLQEGPQSGLIEEVTAVDNSTIVLMVGGVSHLLAVTLGTGDALFTVADGTRNGQLKGFHLVGDQTTNNLVLTFTSAQQNVDANTALTTWTADTALEEIYVEWLGIGADGVWVERLTLGGTIA